MYYISNNNHAAENGVASLRKFLDLELVLR